MGAGGQKPRVPIVCFDRGIRMGLRPVDEWSELLEIKKTTIYNAKKKGSRVSKRYTFSDATPEEVQAYREARSISVMAKAAREQGLSYGELVARRWMEQQNKEEEAVEEVKMDPVEEAVPEEETPKKTKLAFADFAAMIDGHVVLDLYTHRDGEDVWLMSIPSDSPLMEADVVEGTVDFFCIPEGQENALRVYIK